MLWCFDVQWCNCRPNLNFDIKKNIYICSNVISISKFVAFSAPCQNTIMQFIYHCSTTRIPVICTAGLCFPIYQPELVKKSIPTYMRANTNKYGVESLQREKTYNTCRKLEKSLRSG